MKRWLLLGLSLLVLAMGQPAVLGNGPPIPGLDVPWPGGGAGEKGGFFVVAPAAPLPAREVKLVVTVDDKAETPRLQVPYNLLLDFVQILPNSTAQPAKPPKRGADDGRSALPTVVAGVALALALAGGGLWLARRRWGRLLAVLLVLSLSATGTALLWANAPPPPTKPAERVLPVLPLPADIELTDKLMLQAVPNDDHLTLIVPKSMVSEKETKRGK